MDFFSNEDDNDVRVSMTTNNRNYYTELMNQMIVKKFKESSSETTEDGKLRVIYNSILYPNMSIKILTLRLNLDENYWTNYDIEVRRFK